MDDVMQLDVRKIYSVSEVTRDIKTLLEDSFPSVWISGEVSNFKSATSGHYYFTFKDENSQMKVAMFRGSNRSLKFQIEDGQELIIHGNVSVYGARGEYQLIADYAEPKGLGALQLAFEQLKKRLDAEGLFKAEHKKPLPFFPITIGLVTSSKGAVLHDMMNVLRRRYPNINTVFHPVTVQGTGAAQEIAAAIRTINGRDDVDVMIVGRGGGSMEDLWAFNEEPVVRAIFESRIPVISAVGHETDYTLADLVADVRAPTPSAAAELAVPEIADVKEGIDQNRAMLVRLIKTQLQEQRQTVDYALLKLKDPRQYIYDLRQRLDDRVMWFAGLQKNLLLRKRHAFREASLRFPRLSFQNQLQSLALKKQRLLSCSPFEPLKRGYAWVIPEGRLEPIKSIMGMNVGDSLKIQMQDGELDVVVKETRNSKVQS